MDLAFPVSGGTNARSSYNFESFNIVISSTSPLVIVSNNLTVIQAKDSATGILASVIIQKRNVNDSGTSRGRMADPGIERGYMYDGHDCFVYGTIVTADDGEVLFIPADIYTQLLMNRCGYSNVA